MKNTYMKWFYDGTHITSRKNMQNIILRKFKSYFGHIVGSGKLQIDIVKVVAVKDWPAPSCIRDI